MNKIDNGIVIKDSYVYHHGKVGKVEISDFTETNDEGGIINVYPVKKEKFLGFGGAFTDSSAYNYYSAPPEEKIKILEYLFGETGLKYSICRLCIGSSDFATEEFCYVEENDETLSTFNIERDKKYVIPFIKDAINYSKREIKFLASPWSPPAFIKENGTRFSGGKLKTEYYRLYAEYIVKFITAYAEEGIKISAVTIQNEPKAVQTWESCFFTAEEEANLAKVLKEVFSLHGVESKILCWDHNKERLFERFAEIYSICGDIIDGAAFHWYSGEHFGAISALKAKYPDKLAVATEFCISETVDEVNTLYAGEILGDISCGANGIIEWNLVLDENGGPYHNRYGGCDAPVRYDNHSHTVKKSGIYFETYAFSHFIENDAITLYTSSFDESVKACAAKNPNGDMVLVIFNTGEKKNVNIRFGNKAAKTTLESKGLYTIVFSQD